MQSAVCKAGMNACRMTMTIISNIMDSTDNCHCHSTHYDNYTIFVFCLSDTLVDICILKRKLYNIYSYIITEIIMNIKLYK